MKQKIEKRGRKAATDATIKNNFAESCWIVIYTLSLLGGSSLVLSSFLLIPRHNSVIYQEYWYESNFIAVVVLIMSIATNCIESNIYLKLTVSTAIKFFCEAVSLDFDWLGDIVLLPLPVLGTSFRI